MAQDAIRQQNRVAWLICHKCLLKLYSRGGGQVIPRTISLSLATALTSCCNGPDPCAAVLYDNAPVVKLRGPGLNLKDLPGAALLLPKDPVTDVNISLVVAKVDVNLSAAGTLQFANSVYRKDNAEETYIFGERL